jgi:hypothetical protein
VREEAAQRVLLVQAVEAADRDGQLLTREERAQATAPLCGRRVGRRGVSLRRSPSGGLARGDAADLAGRAVAAYLDHSRRTATPLVSARILLDQFASLGEDANLAFPLVDVNANMVHGWPPLSCGVDRV